MVIDVQDRPWIVDGGRAASVSTYVGDLRIGWPDTFSAGRDGHLYFTANQLLRMPGMTAGIGFRQKPFGLYRVPIAGGRGKIGA